ncbi:hypothetical protein A8926_0210 [Saccharopolyspora spinosa]|uniref:Small secreted domain DUF320 n=2 Tax=Saccharopolyspora spinosa TaxID=60894 RepID=A0A2N3XQ63_SACSN|nr:hypothetical protein A8926_0210 [Saccharopolyspora spinosa]
MITSVRILSTATALGLGVLATSMLPQAVAAESTKETPGSAGEAGQGFSICRPISLTGGQITAQCSVAPNGGSTDGHSTAVAEENSEDDD